MVSQIDLAPYEPWLWHYVDYESDTLASPEFKARLRRIQ